MNSAWQIEYAVNARKFLKKVDKAVSNRILQWLNDRILSNNADPYSWGAKLKGDKLGNLWRYRVGDYRVLCKIYDHKLLILVVEIGEAVFKTLYLAIRYITKKWTMPIHNWGLAMAYFMIKFDGRV